MPSFEPNARKRGTRHVRSTWRQNRRTCRTDGQRRHITALDIYEQKTNKIRRLAETLGISIITALTDDARSFIPPTPPDAILLDAPCTGTGVLGRRTELRWKLDSEKLDGLLKLQAELLEHAAHILKEGSVLVYATCSVDPAKTICRQRLFCKGTLNSVRMQTRDPFLLHFHQSYGRTDRSSPFQENSRVLMAGSATGW